MSVKLIPNTFNPTLYNLTTLHPLQSWEWGEARRATGVKILRIGEFKGSDLKKAYLMTLHNIPYTSFKIGYIPRSGIPSKALLDFIKKIAEQHNLIFVKIEPYVEKESTKSLVSNQLNKSPHPLFTNWTIISDLSPDIAVLSSNLKSKTRYNINLAQKKGVYVKEVSNEKGYAIFENLYFETINRQKYKGHNRFYHRKIWEALKNKMSHILIAYYQDIPLAAYHLFIFKDRGYYVYGGSSDKYRNFMASNLLMWESLLFAKKNGCKTFDMWGSLSKDYANNHPWAGFTKFKEGYGGRFIEMIRSYDFIINAPIYYLYNFIYKLREFVLKF